MFVATLVHELGHAIAAIIVGWRIVVFAAGPIGFHAHNRHLALIPRKHRTEVEGFVLSEPRSAANWTRARYIIVFAGGPVANLILAAVAFAVAIWWLAPSRESVLDFSASVMGLGFVSAATAFHTLTPNLRGGRETDVQGIARMLRTDETAWTRQRALSWLYTLAKHNVRLRDLPLWMVDEAREACTAAGGDYECAYDSIIIGIILDSPPVDKAEARQLLDDFRATNGGSAWLDSCDAYFTAIWEGDADRARTRLWVGDAEDETRPMRLAADAAVQARTGNAASARILLARMRAAVRQKSSFPDLTFRDIGRQIESLLPN